AVTSSSRHAPWRPTSGLATSGKARPAPHNNFRTRSRSAERATARAADDRHRLRNMPPFGASHIEQMGALRLAPDCASRVRRIGDDRQGQRPVLRRKADPARDQGQIEQARRDAIVRSVVADVAARKFCRSQARILMEIEHLSTQEPGRQHHANEEGPCPPTQAAIKRVTEEDGNTEHEWQIKRGNDEARRGEAGERHACPTAGNKGDEHGAKHHAAERYDPEQIALERGGKIAGAVIDREAPEPGKRLAPAPIPYKAKSLATMP